MSIPASNLVNIVPRVLSGTGTDLVFNGLLLTEDANVPAGELLTFTTATAVAEYFGYTSEAYTAAQVYFNGYANSTLKPSTLFMFRHVSADCAPFVRGPVSDDANLIFNDCVALQAGNLSLTLSGTTINVTNINLSGCGSLSQVASVVQEAIRQSTGGGEAFSGATVEFDTAFNAFKISGGLKGDQYDVGYCAGTAAVAMRLTESAGAVLSQGANAETYTETMDRVRDVTSNFVTFSTLEEIKGREDVLALCEWTNSQYNAGDQFLYVWHTSDPTVKGGSTDASAVGTAFVGTAVTSEDGTALEIVDAINAAAYNGTTGVYGDVRYAAFIMGAAACVNWNAANSTITLAFKRQSGLEANITTEREASELESRSLNFMGDYASRNDSFVFLQPGAMFGEWRWIDTYLNSTWLNNALQVQILAGFEASGRVPYNQVGYGMIRAWVSDVTRRALNNGVIETGVQLSDTQISELTQEAGQDISSELYNNGYYFQINEADAQTRQNRATPSGGFWYTYGGSVHRLNIPSTAVV